MPRKKLTVIPDHLKGRAKQIWPPMPNVDRQICRQLELWLRGRRNSQRRMSVTGPLLAIVCALHEKGHPLPTRERLAEAVGTTSLDSIDTGISTSIGEGDVTERYETSPGTVARRASTVRRRYLDPSAELMASYRHFTHELEREQAQAQVQRRRA